MTQDPTKRQIFEEAAKRASAQQPDEIRLIAARQHAWSNGSAIKTCGASLLALGFTDAGVYTVDVLHIALQFFLKAQEQIYSVVYEHPKAGIWFNFVVLYENGTSMTFTTTQDRGLEQRPGHPIVHSPGTAAAQLYEIAVHQASPQGRKPLSMESLPGEFERAWAEGIRWRKDTGISVTEVASVWLSRGGQPAKILRPDRIQFVAEQDGVPEREFKQAIITHFAKYPDIEKAYLVYVKYDETPDGSVALCLVSSSKDLKLVEAVRTTFAAQFSRNNHLDIMYVTKSGAERIERVCRPFYS